jgi:hypothetical protein
LDPFYKDNVDELQEFLRRARLWPVGSLPQTHKPSVPKAQRRAKPPIVVVVPQGMPQGGALQTTTPEGYTLQVLYTMLYTILYTMLDTVLYTILY